MIGRIVSQYEITEKLGAGGMGVVYKAFDTKLRRQVALKFMPREMSADTEAKERFVHEAQAAAALDHASICTIHEIGETGDSPEYGESQLFIAMAYYEGQTLDRRIKQGPVPRDEALSITTRIAEGLARAHAEGIVHRDIKPANIMLTDDGEVKILDFGIAKLAGQTAFTRVGSTLGTAAYMSPEQARGEKVDGRSDLWSLGVILYQMLSGQAPFKGEFEQAVIYAILNQEPAELKGEDESIRAIVDRLLTKSSASRYGDCSELLADLQRLSAGEGVRAPRRIPWAIIGITLAVVALVIGYRWLGKDAAQSDQAAVVEESVTAPDDTDRIAVLPFTYHGSEENSWLGNGLMDLMITNLGGTAAGHTVTGSTVLYAIKHLDSDQSRLEGKLVAEFLNVTRFVQGEIVAVGDQLRISAELHDRDSPQSEPLRGDVAGSVEDLYNLVDQLAGQLLVGTIYSADQRGATLARGTTNLKALKSFLVGLDYARSGDQEKAAEAFLQAVAEDSTFGLAWHNLSFYQKSLKANRAAVVRAIEVSGDLPERDQLMMSGWLAVLDGEYDQAEQTFRQVLRDSPQDVYALLDLEGLFWGNNHVRGRSMYEAVPYARRILELAPDFGNFMRWHLTFYAIDKVDLDYLAANPPGFSIVLGPLSKLVQAYDQSPASFSSLLDEPSMLDEPIGWLTMNFDAIRPDPVASLELCRLMLEPTCTPETRLKGRIKLAGLNTARGRFRVAQDHLDSLVNLEEVFAAEYPGFVPAAAMELRAFCAVMPFLDTKPDLVDSLRNALEAWDAESVADYDRWRANNGRHGQIRLYLLGLLDVHRSEFTRALQHAEVLENLAADRDDGPAARDLASGIRARVAFARGDDDEALALLEDIPRKYEHWRSGSIYLSTLAERHLRGEILFSLGRYDEASSWFESTSCVGSMLFNAVRFYHQARCHEALGESEDAIVDYRKFLDLWRDCDPDQRRLVDDAQQRLSALTQQG